MRSSDAVQVERDGAVTTLVFSRPERLNALDDSAISALADAVDEAGRSGANVVVFRGAGRAFSAGGDLRTLAPRGTFDEQVDALTRKSSIVAAIHALPQLTIAAINGPCAGLALGLAGACQLRYASADAVFNTAYFGRGTSGDFGVADALVRTIGSAAALDWLLRPRRIDATQAFVQGFVQYVIPAADFTAIVTRMAADISAASSTALAGVLRNVSDAAEGELPLVAYLRLEAQRHVTAKLETVAASRLIAP